MRPSFVDADFDRAIHLENGELKIAIIGAGLAGLRFARLARDRGIEVRLFEKARGPSGRISTRRTEHGRFDHGAQYFTARTPEFAAQVADWRERGVAALWGGRIARLDGGRVEVEEEAPERYVGTPAMSALARDLSRDLEVEIGTRIAGVRREGSEWLVESENGTRFSGFDRLVVAIPPKQALPLVTISSSITRAIRDVRMRPCHAVMVRFEVPLDAEFDGAFVRGSGLGWVARNDSKPGRGSESCWVLHSSPEWSEANLEVSTEGVGTMLLREFEVALGQALPRVRFSTGHRWLYARSANSLKGEPLWDADVALGICGDWVQGDRLEDAFMSATRLDAALHDV